MAVPHCPRPLGMSGAPPSYNQKPVKNISVLGSTGSIGRASLDVIAAFPDHFRVCALAAGRSIERLAPQIGLYSPGLVSIERDEDVPRLRALLPPGFGGRLRIVAGPAG